MVQTIIGDIPGIPEEALTQKQKCEQGGGTWDEQTQTCIPKGSIKAPDGSIFRLELPKPEVKPPAEEKTPDTNVTFNEDGTVTVSRGGVTETLTKEEYNVTLGRRGVVTEKVSAIMEAPSQEQLRQEEALATGQQLAGQVGRIGPSTGITPTDLSQDEAIRQGIVASIPRALSFAVTAGGAGALAGGKIGAIGGPKGAAIGAVAGFASGMASGFISNMDGQRTDNTNAQQRVLDEGKQTLKDWSTLAKSDPANREFYLSQFNIQLQLIQDAHVQMLTDTNADVAKFESAVPNLAEFNSFYSVGGERDALVEDMRRSLQTPSGTEYEMLALAQRRPAQ